jgi:hypothetical protein
MIRGIDDVNGVDLLDLEDRLDRSRHMVALCHLAVEGLVSGAAIDKQALSGLSAALATVQSELIEIGDQISRARRPHPPERENRRAARPRVVASSS